MATLYTRIKENAQKIYYGDITINGSKVQEEARNIERSCLKGAETMGIWTLIHFARAYH